MSEELNDPMLLRIAEPEGFKGWHKTVVSGTVSIDGMGVFTGEHYAIHDEDCSVVCMLGPVEEGPGNDPGIARRNGLLFLMAPMITAGVREMLAASKRNDVDGMMTAIKALEIMVNEHDVAVKRES